MFSSNPTTTYISIAISKTTITSTDNMVQWQSFLVAQATILTKVVNIWKEVLFSAFNLFIEYTLKCFTITVSQNKYKLYP